MAAATRASAPMLTDLTLATRNTSTSTIREMTSADMTTPLSDVSPVTRRRIGERRGRKAMMTAQSGQGVPINGSWDRSGARRAGEYFVDDRASPVELA